MPLSTARDQIKTTLEGVSGIGVVHKYERFAKEAPAYLTLFKTGGVINGWTITRESTTPMPDDDGDVSHTFFRAYSIIIRGYYSLDDSAETEVTFQNLIESICDTFDADPTISGTVKEAEPIEVRSVGHRMFGNVLVHYCELALVFTQARDRV